MSSNTTKESLTLAEAIRKDPSIFIIFLVVAFVVQRAIMAIITKNRLPPGPMGLPFVGYLPFVTWYGPLYVTLTELAKKYGDIFRIQIGWQVLIVLSKAELVEEAFKQDVFSGRDKEGMNTKILQAAGEDQIIINDGHPWRFNRKIALRALSIFSTSRSSRLEDCIHQSLDWLVKKIREQKGQPFSPKDYIVKSAGSIISSITFGVDPDPESAFYEKLVEIVDMVNKNGTELMLAEVFPPLAVFYKSKRKEGEAAIRMFVRHIMDQVNEQLEDVDTENVADLLSGVEKAIRETPESEKLSVGLRDAEIRRMLVDIFDGGYFTTNETTCWASLLLAQHPEIQELMAKEVLRVVGSESYPRLSVHLADLHLTRAVFYETLRIASLVVLGMPHTTMNTVEFGGYILPKGTQVVANYWALNRNADTFPQPDKFKPDRFLVNGEFSKALAEKVAAFSVGKRRCIGEGIAVQQIPIMLATLVQQFKISLDPATKGDPVKEASFKFTIAPAPHKLIFEER